VKTEKLTRKEIIDHRLQQADWNVTDRTQVMEEFDIHTTAVEEPATPYGGHQYSDYVLLGKDGKPLAVVEAKKTSVDAAIGREQAKQYCYHIKQSTGIDLPFCFYTNGHDIYFWDLDNYPPKKVYGFPTRDDLERYAYIRKARKQLASELINTKIAGRNYQIASIRAVMEAVEKRKRKFLLVMATGTGKTRTCIALVDVLMRAGWVERVLFMVDRIGLRDQTLDAFKEHLPNEPLSGCSLQLHPIITNLLKKRNYNPAICNGLIQNESWGISRSLNLLPYMNLYALYGLKTITT